ncbi:MAG TPA: DNA mismatch repair protein MutS [Candidatus Evtepia faecigallinarum]|nr:DNA mismatch repair protein MutS [Candidatus Evtepia faecigallinarum]
MAELTPMKRQYLAMKEQHPDCLLFFRLGDFYEMFDEDAKTAAAELNLTLTTRDRNKPPEERTPMCGVPYHSAEAYIARLIAKGYKVAICEQTEDPAQAKGLVDREIIRVVTPGTLIEENMLEEGKNNFLASLCVTDQGAGLCFGDISTGEVFLTFFPPEGWMERAVNELARFAPREALLSPAAGQQGMIDFLVGKLHCRVERTTPERFALDQVGPKVREQFTHGLDQVPPEATPAIQAAGALLSYLYETQKTDLSYLQTLRYYSAGGFLELDPVARRNLELTETLRGKEKKGSLLWVLDKTRTAMGGRLLRSWLERPLLDPVAISRRLEAVGWLVDHPVEREELGQVLREITDLERLISRVVYGTAGARDLVSLAAGLDKLPLLQNLLPDRAPTLLAKVRGELAGLPELTGLIGRAIVDEPPFSVREGGLIRDGYHPDVDGLREILTDTKGVIAKLEAAEKEKTGIKSLKVGFNKVFGYYIEVSKSYYDQVPDHYIRKQTLVNCERYITQELKDMEHTILSAQDRIVALEYQLFCQVRDAAAAQAPRIQEIAGAVAQTDVLTSFAAVAAENNYCMPRVDNSDKLEITEGRHPVVEKMRRDILFVPNDTYMDNKDHLAAIITGPNMAGKSTYMRQVALMVLMAQMGSFVPARSARIGVVDRIFTRIGASDDLAGGQSTFMVEMSEVAELLKHATSRSLLILDEIGRGTSTYDGMAIARAVLEWCADPKRLGAKTLFATHYHELTVLEGQLPGVKNFNIAARKKKDQIIFLRKIVPGGADQSYGIEVASLAGLPAKVIRRARELLAELESQEAAPRPTTARQEEQVSLTALGEEEVLDILRNTPVESLTPLQALNLLNELKEKL